MPTVTYEQLLIETLPARIEDDEQYDSVRYRFGELLGKTRRTSAEEKLMDLLAVLIADYDSRNALPPEQSTPDERLRALLEHSGKTPNALLPIFGQRSHVNEAMNGKRPISFEQARKLAKMFNVKASFFV